VVVSHCPDLTRAAIGAHVSKSLHHNPLRCAKRGVPYSCCHEPAWDQARLSSRSTTRQREPSQLPLGAPKTPVTAKNQSARREPGTREWARQEAIGQIALAHRLRAFFDCFASVVKFREVLIFVNEASAPFVLEDGELSLLKAHLPTVGRWCPTFSTKSR
jgi:hypothetical protein